MSGGGSNKIQETADQKEFARVLEEQQLRGEQTFGPLLDRYFADVRDIRPEMGLARRTSTAQTARAFSEVQPQLATAVGQRGGNQALALGGLSIDQGASGGLNLVDTTQATKDQRLRQMGGLLDIGRGEQASAVGGLADVASLSSSQARMDAQTAAQNRLGLQSAVGTGLGLAAYGMYGKKPSVTEPQNYAIGGPYGPGL